MINVQLVVAGVRAVLAHLPKDWVQHTSSTSPHQTTCYKDVHTHRAASVHLFPAGRVHGPRATAKTCIMLSLRLAASHSQPSPIHSVLPSGTSSLGCCISVAHKMLKKIMSMIIFSLLVERGVYDLNILCEPPIFPIKVRPFFTTNSECYIDTGHV